MFEFLKRLLGNSPAECGTPPTHSLLHIIKSTRDREVVERRKNIQSVAEQLWPELIEAVHQQASHGDDSFTWSLHPRVRSDAREEVLEALIKLLRVEGFAAARITRSVSHTCCGLGIMIIIPD